MYTFKEASQRQLATATIKQYINKLNDEHVFTIGACLLGKGNWNAEDANKAIITNGLDANLLDIEKHLYNIGILGYTFKAGKVDSVFFTPDFMSNAVETCKEVIARMPAIMLPRTEPVPEWTQPYNEDLNIPFVKLEGQAKKHLKHYTVDRMPNVYASVNKSQRVPFQVNTNVIPHLKAQLQAFEVDHTQAPADIIAQVSNHNRAAAQLALLESLVNHDELYFTITLDYRGREYYRGGLLSPQGDDFCKSAFKFANAPALGKDGLTGLAIHYANVYGKDKLSLNDRVKWAHNEGLALAQRVVTGHYPSEADKPFQTIVAASEWARIHRLVELGADVEDIKSGVVCHTDGTCNGSQHGAALTGHRATAEAVNCTKSNWDQIPSDVYGLANDSLHPLLEGYPALQEVSEIMGRSLMKKPVMVTGYGAGIKAVVAGMDESIKDCKYISDELYEAARLELLGEDINEIVTAALAEHIGAVMQLTAELQRAVKPVAGNIIKWKTADGFIATQAVRAKTEDDGKTYIGDIRTDTAINESNQLKAISPNFVHSIDATHLRTTVLNAPFDMVTVHDSYGSAPSNFLTMNSIIRTSFVQVHSYDWIGKFNKANGTDAEIIKGDYNAAEVEQSAYFFS